MRRGAWLSLIGLTMLGSLAGCGRSFFSFEEREPWRHDAEVSCLKSGAVKETAAVVRISPIEGPGICGADFPLKVAALGESNSVMGFADDLRPPGAIPNVKSAQPRWPVSQPPAPASSDIYAPAPIYSEPVPAPAAPSYPPPRTSDAYIPPPGSETYLHAPGARPTQPYAPPASRDAYVRNPAPRYQPSVAPGEPLPLHAPGAGDSAPGYPGDSVIQSYPPDRPAYNAPRSYPAERPGYQPPPSYPRNAPAVSAPQTLPALGPSQAPLSTGAVQPVEVKPAATLACPIVSALDQWVAQSVQPAAMRWFGQPVTEIKQISAYSCRGMNGQPGAKISEHAFGNALDIAAFTLADGRKVVVRTAWNGTPQEQGFLHDVQGAACQQFTTVLAPGSNRFHYDHIHVDLMRRSSRRDICQPAAISGEVAAARAAQRSKYAHGSNRDVTGSVGSKRKLADTPYEDDDHQWLPQEDPVEARKRD
jgi:hypothetical protein